MVVGRLKRDNTWDGLIIGRRNRYEVEGKE